MLRISTLSYNFFLKKHQNRNILHNWLILFRGFVFAIFTGINSIFLKKFILPVILLGLIACNNQGGGENKRIHAGQKDSTKMGSQWVIRWLPRQKPKG